MARRRLSLVLLLLSVCVLVINAFPLTQSQTSQALTHPTNVTVPIFLTKDLTYFPPGPPEQTFLYPIIDTDLAIVFNALGLIPRRNETLVKQVLFEATYDSLNYRINAKLPGTGYQLQVREFLLSVSHSVGRRDLTWGMWTIVLRGMGEYVKAYPGYDFQFEVRKYQGWEIEGYVIGAGFVETRG